MDDSPPPPLILVGASVRAAAQSARRAGFAPWAIDLFGDADLRESAYAVHVCRNLTEDLEHLWPLSPPAPWLYTGGLENHPELLHQLARTRPLLGNHADVIRPVRDPRQLQAALHAAGFPVLAVRAGDAPPTTGRWVRKPLRSAGGLQAAFIDADAQPAEPRAEHYFQEYLPEPSATFGATFVMNATQARLLGVCRHLRVPTCAHAPSWSPPPFAYGGAAVWRPPDLAQRELERLGSFLASRFGLTGVVGVDVGCRAAGTDASWYVLEVNPRYPASAQLLDDVGPTSVVGLHVRAARDGELPNAAQIRSAQPAAARVAYVASDFIWTAAHRRKWLQWRPSAPPCVAWLADIPPSPTPVHRGQPLCTFVVRGTESRQVEQQLEAWLQRCEASLESAASCGTHD